MESSCHPDRRLSKKRGLVVLWLKDACLEVDEAWFRSHRREVDGVGLSTSYGFTGKDVSFLADWDLDALFVAKEIDARPVSAFTRLRALALPDPYALDLRAFSRLEQLQLTWHRGLRFPDSFPALEWCRLSRYSPGDRSMSEFAQAPRLGHVEVIQGALSNLRGLPPAVRTIELIRLPQLWSLEGLPSALTDLHVDGCRELRDYRAIEHCQQLRSLVLSDCGPIPSLRFVRSMSNLQRVVLLGATRVVDGDLTPLLAVRDVRFGDRPGYNLTMDEWRRASRRE